MIAIQRAKGGFDVRWIEYCEKHDIDYKIVDCYRSDIINQLNDCQALMWQFYQGSPKDIIMAKSLMYSLEQAGKTVFPNFVTGWHFDDKIGQKYLLEALGLPLAPVWIFYNKTDATLWVQKCTFPKVFKLRGGAGSQNVRLVQTRKKAIKLIKQAFRKGFPQYDPVENIKERWRLFRIGKTNFYDILKGIGRFIIPPPYSKIKRNEKGYIYFQEFIPGNDHDIRVVVIGCNAFAIKRMVRENDFRASGSGNILYDKELIDIEIIKLSFIIAEKLKSQCLALDFVSNRLKYFLVEISYGFSPGGYDLCPGYWDSDLGWHEGKFDPYGWMVEDLLRSVERKEVSDE